MSSITSVKSLWGISNNPLFACIDSKSYLYLQRKCIIYHLVLSFASELQNMQVDSVQSWIYMFLYKKMTICLENSLPYYIFAKTI
jgi:hypothetical protein